MTETLSALQSPPLTESDMIPIAPVVLFVIHIGGATFVPFYDLTACEKARGDLRKLERSIVTKCVLTQTEKEPKL